MKKIIIFLVCLMSCIVIQAQDEKEEGDKMVADGNYSGADMMYRLCIELNNDDECSFKLFKLLYDKKSEPTSSDELFQLISPLAEKGNAEAQFYLGMMYSKGYGVTQDLAKAIKWLQLCADKGNTAAKEELTLINPPRQGSTIPRVNSSRGRTATTDVTTPSKQETTATKTVTTQERQTAGRSTTDINSQYKQEKGSSKTGNILLAVGAVGIVGGAAATYLLPPKITEDWSNSDETGTYIEVKKRNPVFLIAGGVVGGICIGTGIILKSKASRQHKNSAYEYDPSKPVSRPNYDMRLDFVAAGNGAGFRLTF